jgi:hypothetical protein
MIRISVLSVLFAFSAMPDVMAQTEVSLQNYFGGKEVIAKLDLPGTNDGADLDLREDGRGQIDYDSYEKRLKLFGIAIRKGETVTVTKIKLKGKHLEFHLNGGGYGTLGDPTESTVSWTHCAKSSRETDLEKYLKNENSREKRERLQRELNDLRREREREDEHRRRAAESATREKAAEIRVRREQGGSRFNVNFADKPTENDLTPERIMSALADCLVFSWQQPGGGNDRQNSSSEPPPSVIQPSHVGGDLKKGMSQAEVEAIFGAAVSQQESREGSLKVLHCIYETGQERIATDYIDGMLIRYSISSK